MKIAVNILAILTLLLIFSIICYFNIYSFILNKTHHTGFDTYLLAEVFGAFFLCWAGALGYFKYLKKYTFYNYRIFFLILIFSFLGIVNIVLFEKFNIMMYYELWVDKGMP